MWESHLSLCSQYLTSDCDQCDINGFRVGLNSINCSKPANAKGHRSLKLKKKLGMFEKITGEQTTGEVIKEGDNSPIVYAPWNFVMCERKWQNVKRSFKGNSCRSFLLVTTQVLEGSISLLFAIGDWTYTSILILYCISSIVTLDNYCCLNDHTIFETLIGLDKKIFLYWLINYYLSILNKSCTKSIKAYTIWL